MIRPATINDLSYIDSLQKKNAEELSFYPKIVFEREIENQRIILALENNEPIGYLYHGSFSPVLKIHQACIQYDARGMLYGAEMVSWLRRLSESFGCLSITLRCGSDITANGFWRVMGFFCEGVVPGGVRRMRDINCWRYDVQPALFSVQIEPSTKKKDASLWQKRKSSLSSPFLRGKALADYRAKILDETS